MAEKCPNRKLLSSILFVALTAPCVELARADSVPPPDPTIILGPNQSTINYVEVFGTTLPAIIIDQGGGGIFAFENANDFTFNDLLVASPVSQNGAITCIIMATQFFSSCTTETSPTRVFFSGPGTPIELEDGIPPGGQWFFDFNDPTREGTTACVNNDCGSWTPGTYTGLANIPEPSTLGLLLAAITAGLTRRKLRRRLFPK